MNEKSQQLGADSLTAFFYPRGVVVIGASQNYTKLGYGLARNLVQSNYQGAIHFVNPNGGVLFERPVYQQVQMAPDPVDLAMLLVPAPVVPQALAECGERGIKAAVIGSGGFRETGSAGAALEKRCLEIARSYNMRLIGPNCIGLLDTHLPIDATFLPPPGPPAGDVSFISHSGAICAAVIDWARGQGFGLSRLVSLGNQADVNETDVLAPVAADPFTRVLALYLEGVTDGRRFVQEASSISLKKPIVALKVGRFASGQRAVASHTGAMAGHENAFNAAFRRAGVIRVDTSEEMFDWARALAWCPLPKGRNVAILTNAGGPGVTAADVLEQNGMALASLSDATQADLAQVLPPAASLSNPVDMLASASPEQYAQCLSILLADPGVHSVLVILPPPPMYTAGAVAKAVIPIIHHADKPVVIALMGERIIQEAVEHFRAARVPEYRFPERAASALAVLAQRSEYLQRAAMAASAPFASLRDQAQEILARYRQGPTRKVPTLLPPKIMRDLLEIYGIPTPAEGVARKPHQAVELARQMGFPVALKIISPDIPHKTDIGGVLLGIQDEAGVYAGYERILANGKLAQPEAKIIGVNVQLMIPQGQEVIVGAVQDEQFGPLVMFGSGGVEVEGLKDVAFALAPVTEEEVDYLLASTWGGRKLSGYRNIPPADREAVKQVIIRLAQLAGDCPQIQEIEINPLRVLDKGAYALDVRARL